MSCHNSRKQIEGLGFHTQRPVFWVGFALRAVWCPITRGPVDGSWDEDCVRYSCCVAVDYISNVEVQVKKSKVYSAGLVWIFHGDLFRRKRGMLEKVYVVVVDEVSCWSSSGLIKIMISKRKLETVG
jgi:hypothetical protein